jgi:hypothetical protein
MITFKQLTKNVYPLKENATGNIYLLSEEIHKDLQSVLDSDIHPDKKLDGVTKAARSIITGGGNTGLENDKPLMGSSRAVFLPKEAKHITVDGQPTHTRTAVKIAYPGKMDKYNDSGKLLGQHQNESESDHFINSSHGVLRRNGDSSEWKTNENGVLPPHFGHHDDHHHLETGRVDPVSEEDFKTHTQHKDFPEGISHEEFHDAVQHNWRQANGQQHFGSTSNDRMEKLQNHPLVQNVNNFVGDSGQHPSDMNLDNMGTYQHPVTGKKHIVLADYGFSHEVAKHYVNAGKKMRATRQ